MKRKVLAITLSIALLSSLFVFATPISSANWKNFSDWSTPVNLGSVVNSTYNDVCPSISKDGLSLYFRSDRPGGEGMNDIWVSERDSIQNEWQAPFNLGPTINSLANDMCTFTTVDGHWLFFVSNRAGGEGNLDLYMSYREDRHDNMGWEEPIPISSLNTPGYENGPCLVEVGGKAWLYYASGMLNVPAPGYNDMDIYVSEVLSKNKEGWEFGERTAVAELNMIDIIDMHPKVSKDGREIIFNSNRDGPYTDRDMWVSTRASIQDPWTTPVNLVAINSEATELDHALSWDGITLIFPSRRGGGEGGFDLYVCTRTPIKGLKN